MEQDLSDALKMAGALLLFIGALSVAVIALSNTRNGAAGVIESYSDTVEFYDTAFFSNHSLTSPATSFKNYSYATSTTKDFKIESERIVGMESILPNVFDYYDSGYTILFYYLEGKKVKPLPLYCTQSNVSDLYYSKLRIIDGNNDGMLDTSDGIQVTYASATDHTITDIKIKSGVTEQAVSQIYGLDLTDEATRREQWLSSKEASRKFVIDLFNNAKLDVNDPIMPIGYSSTHTTISTEHYDAIINDYFKYTYPNICTASNPGNEHNRGNYYGRLKNASGGFDSYFYSLKFIYSSHIGGTSLAKCKGKFIERMGVYDNTNTIELSEGAGVDVHDTGTGSVVTENVINTEGGEETKYTYITTDAAASRHIIQYIYIGDNSAFDGLLHGSSGAYN